jgi:RNA polymerase sigma-70 factor (ECF subfamily)
VEGVPRSPEAWLLTAARRRRIDALRHDRVRREAEPLLSLLADMHESDDQTDAAAHIPDERLQLMFVCAHPAIDRGVRTPLMLQAVLGLDAATIAAAFLVAPSAMGQRLVRAKTKIRDAGIAFELPREAQLPERLDAVLDAIYAAYGTGWDASGAQGRHAGLANEAVQLARVLAALMPDEAEALGLLGLMLYCESRRDARRNPDGGYVPLAGQDTARWSRTMIDEADALLRRAGAFARPGRYQLEAAIQSVHAERLHAGITRWDVIADLYEALVRGWPSIGARVAGAAATAEARGAQAGLERLEAIDADAVASYQPWWAVRAHLLAQLGRTAEAMDAYERAIGLAEDPEVRKFLHARLSKLRSA